MKTKKGLELRQLSSKSFILEATTEYKESFNKMITFNSTACASLIILFMLLTA